MSRSSTFRARLGLAPVVFVLACSSSGSSGASASAPGDRDYEASEAPRLGRPPASGPGTLDAAADPPEARVARDRLIATVEESPPWPGQPWSDRVLGVMRRVPRHLFAPELPLATAYDDAPQPIGHEQTISQPTVVAMMTQALDLDGSERVLEIGTGSGYQAAVLSSLAKEVFSIEIVEPLGVAARERLKKLGYDNVQVRIGDGYAGWPSEAPFDAIILTAAPPEVPRALVDQLRDGGILVAPVGTRVQSLIRLRKEGGAIRREELAGVVFVPMVPGSAPRP